MIVPLYKLQVVYPDGSVVRLAAGGPVERDLIAACEAAIVRRGVGLFRTEAQVRAAVVAGIEEALLGLKREVGPRKARG